MTNHFHLFMKLNDANLSSGLHDVTSGYATLFNKRHGRSGALFQGRFHAVLVESEGHAWTLSRYIHLNPCRARLVTRPDDYQWSTYRFFLNPNLAPAWLDWRTVFCEFGGSESAARIAYRKYVNAGLMEPPANPFAAAYEEVLYGSSEFINSHKQLLEEADASIDQRAKAVTVEQVMELVSKQFDVSESTLRQSGRHRNFARDAAIWLCREHARLPLTDVANFFGQITPSAVTDTIRRCEARQKDQPEFHAICEEIRQQLRQ